MSEGERGEEGKADKREDDLSLLSSKMLLLVKTAAHKSTRTNVSF